MGMDGTLQETTNHRDAETQRESYGWSPGPSAKGRSPQSGEGEGAAFVALMGEPARALTPKALAGSGLGNATLRLCVSVVQLFISTRSEY